MAISCQKKRPCFDMFPVISCVFPHFLTSQHHTTHTPDHTRFSLFLVVFSVFPHAHSTQHTHSQTHTRTHTCTPATDRDLESGLSKSNTWKNPRNMPEKGKVRGISGECSFRYRRANRSSAARWRNTDRTIRGQCRQVSPTWHTEQSVLRWSVNVHPGGGGRETSSANRATVLQRALRNSLHGASLSRTTKTLQEPCKCCEEHITELSITWAAPGGNCKLPMVACSCFPTPCTAQRDPW